MTDASKLQNNSHRLQTLAYLIKKKNNNKRKNKKKRKQKRIIIKAVRFQTTWKPEKINVKIKTKGN